MTADQRLDQLEPLVSQTLAVADRHTAQLRQISTTVGHLQEAASHLLEAGQVQSDNIQFVLRELSEVRTDLDVVKHRTNGIQQNQSLTSTRLGDLENAVSIMGSQVSGLDAKVSGLDAKVSGLDAKVTGLDAKVSGMDAKVSGLDAKVTGLDAKVTGLDAKVTGLDAKVTGLDAKVTGMDAKLDQLLGLLGGNK